MGEGMCMQSLSQPEDRGLAARGAVVQRKLITRLSHQYDRLEYRTKTRED